MDMLSKRIARVVSVNILAVAKLKRSSMPVAHVGQDWKLAFENSGPGLKLIDLVKEDVGTKYEFLMQLQMGSPLQ